MESAQEVRYSGVVVGRGVPIRDRDASGAFVVLAEPLPVGTRITLRGEGGDEEARVTVVTESANPDLAGMRIVFVSAAKPAAKSPPVEAPPPAAQKPPVIEKPPEPQPPPVVEAAAAAPAATAIPVAPEAPHAVEAAPTEAPGSDSTASSAMPAGPTDPGMGGKRRRRRR